MDTRKDSEGGCGHSHGAAVWLGVANEEEYR